MNIELRCSTPSSLSLIKSPRLPALALLLAAAVLCGCISEDEPQAAPFVNLSEGNASGNATEKIKVAASIAPLGDFVRAVGKDRVEVMIVIPPGAEPHTFEPTPSLMVKISQADLYVMNGAGLEFWIARLLEANRDLYVVDSSRGIDLLKENAQEIDPHIWLSLRNAEQQVQNIAAALSEVDPDGSDLYSKNRDDYIEKLRALDQELNRSFASAEKKIFVVHHPAWTYFARDYGLRQIPLMENEKEPGPKYLGHVIDLAREENITTIFVEPEYNPKAAEVIAREMAAKVVSLDPLAEGYLENMGLAGREIAESMAG
jgi:zinc transport system substrate-binding protein